MQQTISHGSHGNIVNRIRIVNCVFLPVWLALLTSCATVPDDSSKPNAALRFRDSSLYEIQPNIKACKAGMLSNSARDRVLQTVNKIRSLHGLTPVTYNTEYEPEVMETALMMAANGKLNHDPPSSWKCYSAKGANGAKHSNLHGGLISKYLELQTPEQIVTGWLTDVRNASGDNVGHRRWLLDPFLQNISFGMVAGRIGSAMTSGAAIRIIWEQPGSPLAPQPMNEFIAYPINDYPGELFDRNAIISFSALVNHRSKFDNTADYSKATVRVTDEQGDEQAIRSISSDKQGFGIPNVIQFSIRNMQYNKKYIVEINNVYVGKTGATEPTMPKNYSYWFRII